MTPCPKHAHLCSKPSRRTRQVVMAPACMSLCLILTAGMWGRGNHAADNPDVSSPLSLSNLVQWAFPFTTPVDTVKYFDYLDAIQTPMDLGTVKSRLDSGPYKDPKVGRGPSQTSSISNERGIYLDTTLSVASCRSFSRTSSWSLRMPRSTIQGALTAI